MTNELKKEIASWYPGITDAELNDVIDDLINFFAIGAKAVYEATFLLQTAVAAADKVSYSLSL